MLIWYGITIPDQTMRIFFKIVIYNIARLHPSPHPLTLTAYPTSRVGWFVVPQLKMTMKDIKEIT